MNQNKTSRVVHPRPGSNTSNKTICTLQSSISIIPRGRISLGVYPYGHFEDTSPGNVNSLLSPACQNSSSALHTYTLRRAQSISSQVELHKWGVRFKTRCIKPKASGGWNGESGGISRKSRRSLLLRTLLLEHAGVRPTHMITLTLPREYWEMLNPDERVQVWRKAKRHFLQALGKQLRRRGIDWGALWFQEFQKRGAPHLHILVEIGELTDEEWERWLKWFIKVWARALGGDIPEQAVDFKAMRIRDFRYVRKYASKAEQKQAPWLAHWGRWWSCMGTWARIKDEVRVREERNVQVEQLQEIARQSKKLASIVQAYVRGKTKVVDIFWGILEQSDVELARTLLQRREEFEGCVFNLSESSRDGPGSPSRCVECSEFSSGL